jgi:hypothetical protein
MRRFEERNLTLCGGMGSGDTQANVELTSNQ